MLFGLLGDMEQQRRAWASAEAQQRLYQEQIARLNAEHCAAAQRAREAAATHGDVIDLVPDADGVYGVPAALEHRVRT